MLQYKCTIKRLFWHYNNLENSASSCNIWENFKRFQIWFVEFDGMQGENSKVTLQTLFRAKENTKAHAIFWLATCEQIGDIYLLKCSFWENQEIHFGS